MKITKMFFTAAVTMSFLFANNLCENKEFLKKKELQRQINQNLISQLSNLNNINEIVYKKLLRNDGSKYYIYSVRVEDVTDRQRIKDEAYNPLYAYDLIFGTFYSVRGYLRNFDDKLKMFRITNIKEDLFNNEKLIKAPKKLEISLKGYDSSALFDDKRKILYFTKDGYFYYILKAMLKNNTLPVKAVFDNGKLLIPKGEYQVKFSYRGLFPDESLAAKILRASDVKMIVNDNSITFESGNNKLTFNIVMNNKYTDKFKVLMYAPKADKYYLLKVVGLNKEHKYVYSFREYTKDFFKSKDIAYRFYLQKEGK